MGKLIRNLNSQLASLQAQGRRGLALVGRPVLRWVGGHFAFKRLAIPGRELCGLCLLVVAAILLMAPSMKAATASGTSCRVESAATGRNLFFSSVDGSLVRGWETRAVQLVEASDGRAGWSSMLLELFV